MKTTTKIRLFAITALMATIAAGSSFEANAQQRNSRDSRNNQREDRKESSFNQKSYNNRDGHSRNDRDAREIRPSGDIRQQDKISKSDVYRRHENENKRYAPDKNKGKNPYDAPKKYEKPNYHKHYDGKYSHNQHPDFYHHPTYGKTYRRFYTTPYVLQHGHGRYYYYNGHFCSYRPGIGYVTVNVPFLTVFSHLPFHCKKVRIHGNVYYRYGNLYFEALPIGYRLVPSPVQVHISARF